MEERGFKFDWKTTETAAQYRAWWRRVISAGCVKDYVSRSNLFNISGFVCHYCHESVLYTHHWTSFINASHLHHSLWTSLSDTHHVRELQLTLQFPADTVGAVRKCWDIGHGKPWENTSCLLVKRTVQTSSVSFCHAPVNQRRLAEDASSNLWQQRTQVSISFYTHLQYLSNIIHIPLCPLQKQFCNAVNCSSQHVSKPFSSYLFQYWVTLLFGLVFRWDHRWVQNTDWDQRSAKSEVNFSV